MRRQVPAVRDILPLIRLKTPSLKPARRRLENALTIDGFPLRSWRLHLSCVRLDGSDSLVLVGRQQRRRAVPSFDVVEVLAPGDDDSAGLGAGVEMMRDSTSCSRVEKNASEAALSTPDPAHRLHNPEPAAQFREILCRVG